MAQTIQHDQTAFFSELSTTGAPNISSTDASGSEHSNAVVSIPLVQNIRQVNPHQSQVQLNRSHPRLPVALFTRHA
jgi:hypothetical protein